MMLKLDDQTNKPFSLVGLKYLPNYIDRIQEEKLIETLDRQPWLTDLKRRVQHYGYKYDYKKRRVDYSMFLGELPEWLDNIADRLYRDRLFKVKPDQAIINEYNPGQGITSHIDCVPCFGDTIIALSLGSTCIMQFSQDKEKIDLLLEPGSLIVMEKEARYNWKHSIPARKKDKYLGEEIIRKRRISITFRKVIVDK